MSTNVVAEVEIELATEVISESVVEQLVEQAKSLKLAEESAWLNLLHYKTGFYGAQKSQADDFRFFLSKEGSGNAEAELEANLRAFAEKSSPQQANSHPQCRFPARYHWLSTRLAFNDKLPNVNCTEFNEWRGKLNAQQVTLLFPSMHLDNPASMFGHTFIRFDEPGSHSLLSKTLSYAAATDKTDSGLVYAWKGIMGGYNGQFYLKAYFETLQEYSDIEQRDIWEYGLNLSRQEVEQLVRHLWEVRGIKFDYYFFRENCAFRLLALLDVARENINMSQHSHPIYAAPVDTVRDIENAGLIKNRFYRPAAHNKISLMSAQLEERSEGAALAIASGETSIKELSSQFNEKEQAKIYLLADQILSLNNNLSEDEQRLQLDILSARSKLLVKPEDVEFKYAAKPPEISHPSARWQLSAGELEQQRFYEIGIRPVFHDLLDMPEGFINGAAISVLDTELRWYKEKEELKLEKIKLFSIRSIVAVKPWMTPLSRQFSLEIKKRNQTLSQRITELEAQFDIGYATDLSGALVYFMAKTQIEYATELEDNHAFHLGAETGLLWNYNNTFLSGQAELVYQNLQNISGEKSDIQGARAGLQFNVSKNYGLRFEYEYTEYETFDIQEGSVSLQYYF